VPSMFDIEDTQPEIRTLSKDEAAAVRASNPSLNPWKVVGWQLIATLTLGLLGLLLTQKWSVAYSLVWGGLCVALPSAVFARGMMSKFTQMNAGTATAGFFLWELVKIALSLSMLAISQMVVADLDWPAMLVSMVLVMKGYLFALWYQSKIRRIKPI